MEISPLLARFFLGGPLLLEHRVLALEDDLLLLGPRLGDDALGVGLGVLDPRSGKEASGGVPQSGADQRGDHRHDQDEDGFRQSGSLRQWSPHWALLRRCGASDFIRFRSAARIDEGTVKRDGECTPPVRQDAQRRPGGA